MQAQPQQQAAEIRQAPVKAEAKREEAQGLEAESKTSEASDVREEPTEESSFDCDEIWNAVFEDGEAAKGSFYIIGSGGRLTEIGDGEFTVAANSEHVKNHAEKNRQLLEDLMEKHTGKRRVMKLVMSGEQTRENKKSVEEIAREAEGVLGIDIEIQ